MKNFFYSLVLVSIIVFGVSTTKNSFAESDSLSLSPNYPYKIVEVQPSGETGDFSGESSNFDPRKVVADLGLTVYPEDRVSAFPDPKIGIGSVINLERAPVIKLRDGKKELELRSWVTTAGELLAEKGIELGLDDKTNFRSDSRIYDGIELSIIRVAITKVVESEAINFKTIKKEDPKLDKGKTRVETAGVKGERELTYQVTREDGVEVSRVLVGNEVVKEPVNQVEYYGTKPVITVRCRYNDTVLAASIKYKQDPNTICSLMMKESNGNPGSINPNGYYGLFQYELGLWTSASSKAGYSGADWSNPTAQIYTTCYLFSIGQSWRW